VLPAQALAQTRAGARGALFFHSCVSPSEFGTSWPEAVPLQIQMMDAHEWTEADRAAAEALVEKVPTAELFLYPGSAHLFADPNSGDYNEKAAALLKERTLAFLHRVG
jgi:dienelactone hydrolase